MIFRSGKYKGLSLTEVKRINPSYIAWVRENRPEMLKTFNKPKTLKTSKYSYIDPPDIPKMNEIKPGSLKDAF